MSKYTKQTAYAIIKTNIINNTKMLIINNLEKTFGDLKAVDNLCLKIESGKFFSLIGPNGSGKTTIIKTILGLLRPSSGHILVNNVDVVKFPVKAKSIMAYIPDNPQVWSHVTGEEFLYFSGILYGLKAQEVMQKIPTLLNIFNLQGIEKSYFSNYSRGNKQKFSILAAFIHEPKFILIDEPIVGLDPESAEIAMNLLKDFTKKGGTVFLTTHTLTVAEKYSDLIGIINKGKLVSLGTLSELKTAVNDQESSLLEIYLRLKNNV